MGNPAVIDLVLGVQSAGPNGFRREGGDSPAIAVPPAEPGPWADRIDDLLRARALEDDWDGQGAMAPPPDLVDSAIVLANYLSGRWADFAAPCRAVPGPTGTVLFEWQLDDGTYFEIEVTEPHRAEYTIVSPGQPTRHGSLFGE